MIRISGDKFILNAPNLHVTLCQHSQLVKNHYGVPSKPGDCTGYNDVQLALPAVVDYPIEVFPVVGV